jgi:hypothetical protein
MSAVTRLVDVKIDRPDAEAESSASRALAEANAIEIKTPMQFEDAAGLLRTIKSRRNLIDAERKKLIRPIDEAWQAIQSFFKKPLDDHDRAEAIVKKKIADYNDHVERMRREEQARIDAAARKEREKLEQRAAKAEESGKVEKAEQLRQTAATVVAPIMQVETPKVAGLTTREVWRYEITDPSKVAPAFLMPDEAKIGKTVRALKADAAAIVGPGVRIWPDQQIASRS